MTQALHKISRRPAFTLVEMLLASALLTLLMVGLLAVVTDVGASTRMLRAVSQTGSPSAETPSRPDDKTLIAFVRLLQDDLQHAQSIDTKHVNQLRLIGYAVLNADAPRAHRPVEITYVLEDIAHRSCLIRRQKSLDEPSSANTRRDLVCCGIERFVVAREPAASEERGPGTTSAPHGSAAGRWKLQVWAVGSSAPVPEQFLNFQRGNVP